MVPHGPRLLGGARQAVEEDAGHRPAATAITAPPSPAPALGGMKYMHEQGDLPIEGIHHIGQPYWYAEGGDLTPAEFGLKVARELEAKIDELGEENVAAFVAEPIQGAGGVIIPPETYWPEIARICKARNILLVADEVICGFGRTRRMVRPPAFRRRAGSWHRSPRACPPATCRSAACWSSDRVAEVLINEVGDFNHGFTYSGHPGLRCRSPGKPAHHRGGKLVERVRDDIGPYFAKSLEKSRWITISSDRRKVVGLMGGRAACR